MLEASVRKQFLLGSWSSSACAINRGLNCYTLLFCLNEGSTCTTSGLILDEVWTTDIRTYNDWPSLKINTAHQTSWNRVIPEHHGQLCIYIRHARTSYFALQHPSHHKPFSDPSRKPSNHPKNQVYLFNMYHRRTCFLLALLALVTVAFAVNAKRFEKDISIQGDAADDMEVAERGGCRCYKRRYHHCRHRCYYYSHGKKYKGWYCC
ncbi:unnamed protein product [Chondrus crispus]|uniref:Uncharacterized protein n=1 Tax=Chondrus crispus TaxID=2769 RepID=S0F2R1_CHOCR|nr:unnamed protein product [Chondrus crispus]CDF77386.1 unnamed protein product [Chondrus crispus]|eukprot:XP_005712260.1 unnamed protein product [Chondrus crispus]